MKKIILICLLILFCVFSGRVWYLATDGFRLARIISPKGAFEELPISQKEESLSEEGREALTQRYFYLGRGRQCFAFQSENGKHVLKFPRLDRYHVRFWLRCLNFLKADRSRNNTISRKKKLLNSFEISYDELRDDTAIIAMSNPYKQMDITLVDRLGRMFQVPLANTRFILQKKVSLFKDVFQAAFRKKDQKELEKIFDQLLTVIIHIAKKGILSKDGSFLRNFGFDGTRAYQIDVGSFYRQEGLSPEEAFHQSIDASMAQLRVWLQALDPALLELVDRKLETLEAIAKLSAA